MPVTVVRTEVRSVSVSIDGYEPGPSGEKSRSLRGALPGPDARRMLTEGSGRSLARRACDPKASADVAATRVEPAEVPENAPFLVKCYLRLLSALLGLTVGAGEVVDFYA